MSISRLLPIVLRRELLKLIKSLLWPFYIKKFYKAIKKGKNIDKKLIRKLIFAWGNEGFSAKEDYLFSIVKYAKNTCGNILETGSGLSTIILNIIANQNSKKVFSLEHEQYWADKSKKQLSILNIPTDGILKVDLKSYGDFDWYNADQIKHLLSDISLIICDGPPGYTNGGRYGLIPIFKKKINKDCLILVDDMIRKQEQEMVEKWKKIVEFDITLVNEKNPFAILKIK